MYLKRIELFGFKSFADKTAVDFLPGITCIVGPNGCGKSNISDAIRWVLGERSAKMLRGSKMQDVIFNGTSFRKPVNMSEVSLVIDNRDRVLSIAYDEVVLTRRLYRSGESEYFINKTLCRAKDIQDLIMDTGIGSHSYSMIEQGRIDHILQADPDERRFLIEEAAGISRYKSQKEEAVRKLERTENNLLRLVDIVSEVEKQIKYAERQARRAERYREYHEELKQKETRRSLFEKVALEEERTGLLASVVSLNEKSTELTGRVESLKVALHELEREEEEKLQEIRFKENKRFELKSEIQNRENTKAFNFEKIGEFRNQIETLEKEIQSIDEALIRSVEEIKAARSEAEVWRGKRDGFEGARSSMHERVREKESALSELESRNRQTQEILFEKAGETAQLRNEVHNLELKLAAVEVGLRKARQNSESAVNSVQSYEARLKTSSDALRSKEERSLALESELSQLKTETEAKTAIWREAESLQKESLEVLRRTRGRIELLEELNRALVRQEGLGEDFYGEMETREGLIALYRTVAIRPGFEKPVEKLLGEALKALVLTDDIALERLEACLKTKSFRTVGAAIRPLPPYPAKDTEILLEGGRRLVPAAELVEVQEGFEDVISSLLSSSYLAESPISAEEFRSLASARPELRVIETSGRLWSLGGLVTIPGELAEDGLLERENEKRSLEARLPELDAAFRAADTRLVGAMGELESLKSRLASCVQEAAGARTELELLRRAFGELEQEAARERREVEVLASEIQHLETDQKSAEEGSRIRRERLAELEREQSSLSLEARKLEEEIGFLRRDLEELLRQKQQQDMEYAGYEEKIRVFEEQANGLERRTSEETAKRERYHQRIGEYRGRLQDIRFQNEQLEEELKGFRATLQDEELVIHRLNESRAELQEKKKRVAENLAREERGLESSRTQLHRDQMKAQEIEFKVAAIIERIEQSYKVDLRLIELTAEERAAGLSESLDEEIQFLKEKLADVGTVNLLAVEEYEELKKRFDFLDGQKRDLEKAKEELMEAIRKINRTTKKLFEDTYDQVRQNFQEFFRTLFGGGQADLVMLDEANPLDSGIDIIARPPGKKPQTIGLLSGGEKALTAIALLFSLFKIKPSPFSVLDEVDAPLDEANIDRFLKVLESFLTTSQFIIVTHNRKTIAMGSTLYGVTMQEAGVSKVVSVRLQEDQTDLRKTSVTEQSLSANISLPS